MNVRELPIDHPPVRGMKNAAANEQSGSFWKDIARWSCAGGLVFMAHIAGAYALHASQPQMLPDGEPPAAIMMELDPVAQAPEVEQEAATAMAETAQNPQLEETEPEQPVEQTQEPEAPQPVAQQEPAEETPPEVAPAPVTPAVKPEVVLPKQVAKPVVQTTEPQVQKPKKPAKPKQQAKKAAKAEQNQQAAAPQLNAQNSSRVAANKTVQSNAAAGVSSAKWQSKVQAHLERKKRAAQRSLGRGAKGIVQVAFVIDAAGKVLSARVSGSSGNAQIDQAALEAVKRASPVPAPPPAMAASRIPFAVPFRFN